MFRKRERKGIKKWQLILLAVVLVFAFSIKTYYYFYWPETKLIIADRVLNVLVANTDGHLYKGLSDREDLGEHDGMLFIFPRKGRYAIVMRDMNFPIDIIWIDGNQIVDIAPNVQPEPGKSNEELTRYYPRVPANLVLELPAGFAEENQLKIVDQVEILE